MKSNPYYLLLLCIFSLFFLKCTPPESPLIPEGPFPLDGSVISARQAADIVFQWDTIAFMPTSDYASEFNLYELDSVSDPKGDKIIQTYELVYRESVRGSQFGYPKSAPGLESGKVYAWEVKGRHKEVSSFRVRPPATFTIRRIDQLRPDQLPRPLDNMCSTCEYKLDAANKCRRLQCSSIPGPCLITHVATGYLDIGNTNKLGLQLAKNSSCAAPDSLGYISALGKFEITFPQNMSDSVNLDEISIKFFDNGQEVLSSHLIDSLKLFDTLLTKNSTNGHYNLSKTDYQLYCEQDGNEYKASIEVYFKLKVSYNSRTPWPLGIQPPNQLPKTISIVFEVLNVGSHYHPDTGLHGLTTSTSILPPCDQYPPNSYAYYKCLNQNSATIHHGDHLVVFDITDRHICGSHLLPRLQKIPGTGTNLQN